MNDDVLKRPEAAIEKANEVQKSNETEHRVSNRRNFAVGVASAVGLGAIGLSGSGSRRLDGGTGDIKSRILAKIQAELKAVPLANHYCKGTDPYCNTYTKSVAPL